MTKVNCTCNCAFLRNLPKYQIVKARSNKSFRYLNYLLVICILFDFFLLTLILFTWILRLIVLIVLSFNFLGYSSPHLLFLLFLFFHLGDWLVISGGCFFDVFSIVLLLFIHFFNLSRYILSILSFSLTILFVIF